MATDLTPIVLPGKTYIHWGIRHPSGRVDEFDDRMDAEEMVRTWCPDAVVVVSTATRTPWVSLDD